MDSPHIERVIDCIETDNENVGRIVKIKGGEFVEGFTKDTHCVGCNIRRKVSSRIDNPKRGNILYTRAPITSGRNIGPASITVVRARGYVPNGEEISNNPSNLNARGQSHPSKKVMVK